MIIVRPLHYCIFLFLITKMRTKPSSAISALCRLIILTSICEITLNILKRSSRPVIEIMRMVQVKKLVQEQVLTHRI